MQKQSERTQIGWNFWLLWVLANTVAGGVASAAAVGLLVSSDASYVGAVVVFYALVGGLFVALIVFGFSHWLILRRWMSEAVSCIVAIIGAVTGAVTVGVALVVFWYVLVGFLRWFEPRNVTENVALVVVGAVIGAVFGFLYGTITRGALVWLLRQRRSEQDQTVEL